MAALEQRLQNSLGRIVELENEVNMLTDRMDQIQHAMDRASKADAAVALGEHNRLKNTRKEVRRSLARAKSHHGGSRRSLSGGGRKSRRRR
jgi:predicted  nucleic acid-binding Zn-ribbon protein